MKSARASAAVPSASVGAAAITLPPALPRRAHSAAVRTLAKTALHCLLRPLLWMLRLFGVWPRALARSGERMHAQFKGYTPGAHDVLVCAYFKSGTNWTMQMALQVAWRGSAEFEHIHDLVPWVELPRRVRYTVPVSDSLWQCSPAGLRVIKTHLPIGKIAYNESGKYIWVVRDPKDVFVSGYHFIRSTMLGPLMPSVEEWLDLYLSGDSFMGSWAEHLASGWQLREADNVLFLTYEQMLRDRRSTIEKIAALMGVQLSPSELESVDALSSYEHMKSISEQFDTRGLSPPWVEPRRTMIRRGRSGGSGELLSPRQQARIDEYWSAQLTALGCDFPYAERYGGSGLA